MAKHGRHLIHVHAHSDGEATTFEGREFLYVSVLANVEARGASVLVLSDVGACELQLVQHVCVTGRRWHSSVSWSLKRGRGGGAIYMPNITFLVDQDALKIKIDISSDTSQIRTRGHLANQGRRLIRTPHLSGHNIGLVVS